MLSLLSLACLLPATLAQTFSNDMSSDPSRQSLSASFMNITFSTQAGICSSTDNTTDSAHLSIAVRTVPQSRTCFDFSDIFRNPDETYTGAKGSDCDGGGMCGVNYTIISPADGSGYNSSANYSQVFYTQVNPFAGGSDSDDTSREAGRLEMRTYRGSSCGHGSDSYEWNCLEQEGICNTMPWAIKSFSVEMTKAGDVGMGSCVVAQLSDGVARVRSGLGLGAVILGATALFIVW